MKSAKKHSESKMHKAASEQMKLYYLEDKLGRIDQQLDPNFRDMKLAVDQREHLLTVLEVILFCAQREIPLRGDDESDKSLNRVNFRELLSLLSQYDSKINERLEKMPSNAGMLSPNIQNDLLESSKQVLLEQIKTKIHAAEFYAILADEVKDVSKKELDLGVSLRYVADSVIRERAIGFVQLKDLSAQCISDELLKLLQPFDLEPVCCVGQGYDGASFMSGKEGGVQAVTRRAGYRYALCKLLSLRIA